MFLPEINSFFLHTGSSNIDGKELRGSLWYQISSGELRCLDKHVEPLKKPESDLTSVDADLAPFLLTTESLEERCVAFLSGQLEGVVLEKGEHVLVRRPGARTGDPHGDLVEKEIRDTKGIQITVDGLVRWGDTHINNCMSSSS